MADLSTLVGLAPSYARMDVALDKSVYAAGDTVNGLIQLEVLRPTAFRVLAVELRCKALTRVTRPAGCLGRGVASRDEAGDAMSPEMATQRLDAAIFAQDCAVEPGSFQFAFDFALPAAAAPSVYACKQGALFRTEYTVHCALERQGFARPLRRVYAFTVASAAPDGADAPVQVTASRSAAGGAATATISAERRALRFGEDLRCAFTLHNMAGEAHVRSVEVFLEETHSVQAREFRSRNAFRTAVAEMPCDVPPGAAFEGAATLAVAFASPDLVTRNVAVGHRLCLELCFAKPSPEAGKKSKKPKVKRLVLEGPVIAAYGPMPLSVGESNVVFAQALLAQPVPASAKMDHLIDFIPDAQVLAKSSEIVRQPAQ